MDKITKAAFGQMRALYLEDKDTLLDTFHEMSHDEMGEILLGAMEYTCQGLSNDIRENADFVNDMSLVAAWHSSFAGQFKFVVEGSTHGAPTAFLIRMLRESEGIALKMAETCANLMRFVELFEKDRGAKYK